MDTIPPEVLAVIEAAKEQKRIEAEAARNKAADKKFQAELDAEWSAFQSKFNFSPVIKSIEWTRRHISPSTREFAYATVEGIGIKLRFANSPSNDVIK